MVDYNWGMIRSGATFEGLVTTLVFFEDPRAVLLGRPGKDGGQDVRSGNGDLVYQAKFHADASSASAIRDARLEAKKIEVYKNPDSPRQCQWAGVTKWKLVTNAEFNTSDDQRWNETVVPIFRSMGIEASYWERVTLDALMVKHPEVARSYFGNEPRALLTLPEAHERLSAQTYFLPRAQQVAFQGRGTELQQVRDFVASDKSFLMINGPGGVGKTRLLYEAGLAIATEAAEGEPFQVLWANVRTMEKARWYEGMIPERPTVLLVDEPESEDILLQLAEHVGGALGRAGKWKVIVSVRSPKDPVVRFLKSPSIIRRTDEISLQPLPDAEARAFCEELLVTSPNLKDQPKDWPASAARQISKSYKRYPVWMTLAIDLLERVGSLGELPTEAEGLAEAYLQEAYKRQDVYPAPQLQDVVRHVALLGTVNRESDEDLQLLSTWTGIDGITEIKQRLTSLVRRRVLQEWGARTRLVEVRPDVLRDHVLLHWLFDDAGNGQPLQPSDAATRLVRQVADNLIGGAVGRATAAVLRALARTEWLLRSAGRTAAILDSLFEGLRAGLQETTAFARVAMVEALTGVARLRTSDIVELCHDLRTTPCSSDNVEGLLGPFKMDQDDVVLSLPWMLFHAAMGAMTADDRLAVLRELSMLMIAEMEIASRRNGKLPLDGKRASELMRRVLEGGPHFFEVYDEQACTLGLELLDEVSSAGSATPSARVLTVLLGPLTAVERRKTWSEDVTIHLKSYIVPVGHALWQVRTAILNRIRQLIEVDQTQPLIRPYLWNQFAEAHRSLTMAAAQTSGDAASGFAQATVDDLRWALEVLTRRVPDLEELKSARRLWEWHYQYDEEPTCSELAAQLESLWKSNELAIEMEPLVAYESWPSRIEASNDKARSIAASPEAIRAFVARAVVYLGSPDRVHEVASVACELGRLAPESPAVQSCTLTALAEMAVTPLFRFATVVACCWIEGLRSQGATVEASRLAQDLVSLAGSASGRAHVLLGIYGDIYQRTSQPFTDLDLHLMRSNHATFCEANREPEFLGMIGRTFNRNWEDFRRVVEDQLDSTPPERAKMAVHSLVKGIHRGLGDIVDNENVAWPDIGSWVLDQLLRLANIDTLGGGLQWEVDQILNRVGRPSLAWLVIQLRHFAELEATTREEDREWLLSLSGHRRISRYVSPLDKVDSENGDQWALVRELVALSRSAGSVGYVLPTYIGDVDPEGRIAPSVVAERMSSLRRDEIGSAIDLARFGGIYKMNSAPWRTIAKPVVRFSAGLTEGPRRSLYASLLDSRSTSYSSAIGQVPQFYVDKARLAKEFLEDETEEDLVPFWRWYLMVAEDDLRREGEQAKEDRGE